MKKYLTFVFVIILTNCSNAFYDVWNSGGYSNPTLSPVVVNRKSGDYFPFELQLDNSSDVKIKYAVRNRAISSYKDNFNDYDKPIPITTDCVVSVYRYTATEISPITHFDYHILRETPEASVIVEPSTSDLRWDELSNGIKWTNTISNYELDYWLEFDFDDDGVPDYSINTGKDNTIVLSANQINGISHNNCVVNMQVDIKDRFGSLIVSGKRKSYRYSHKKILPTTINSNVLNVTCCNNDYFIATAGPDNNNDNKIGISFGLYSFDYKQKMSSIIDSDLNQTVLSITADYKNERGVIFFTEDTSPISTIYPIFNILPNACHDDIGDGFNGESPFVAVENDHYNLIYLKKSVDKNSVLLRAYDLNGVFKNEKVIIDNLSLTDRLVNVDTKNNRYNIAVEYFDSVRQYKNYIFDSNFSHYDIYTVGNNTSMDDYSTVLNQDWCGSIWKENNQYIYKAFSLVDSSMSSVVVVDYPFISRAGIWGIDGVNWGILYQADFDGGTELFYRRVSNDGSLYKKDMITNDDASRSFIRIKNSYAFWLEDNNPVMCRIF